MSNKLKYKAMKIKVCLAAILIFLYSLQVAFAQKETSRKKLPIVSCSDCNAKALSLPKPEYPKSATFVKASGVVQVQILIDENGNVETAEAVSGHPLLQASAIKAALQAKFEPLFLSGKPFKVRGVIVYNFVSNKPTQTKQNEENLPLEEIPNGKTIVDLKSGTVVGKAVKLFKPPFPSNCRCKFAKIKKVVVQFTVNENGDIESANGITGHPLLKAASEIAIRKSKFSISRINGMPVKAYGIIIYDFVISRNRWKTLIVKQELKL